MGCLLQSFFKCSKENEEYQEFTEPILTPQNIIMNKNNFLFKSQFNESPFKSYEIISEITPTLKIVLKNNTKIKRLMKIIDGKIFINDDKKKSDFKKSINYLQLLDHSNINKIYEVYIYEDVYYLISDYNEENNLIEKIKNKGIEEESTIHIIMGQLFSAIIYLHNNDLFNIYNIELRLDKLTIIEMIFKSIKTYLANNSKNSDNNDIDNIQNEEVKRKEKIKRKIDVKLSVLGYLNENYSSELDHLIYYPPEIIEQIENNDMKKNYSNQENNRTDEWACGIIMYYLITGDFPFKGTEKEEICSNIKYKEIDFSSPKFDYISNSCKDLISKLLEKDRKKRITVSEYLEHPFFTGENLIKEEEKEKVDIELLNHLLTLKKPKSKFHELIDAYLCLNFLDKNEEKKLNELFKYIDEDHNNTLSEDNIKNAFQKNNIKYNDDQIKNILYVFDYNQNNTIQYQEFLRVLCDKDDLYKEENMQNVFNAIDIDKKQYIDIKDIQIFVPNDDETKSKIEKEFTKPFGMKNEDKMIYEQFCKVIRKNKTYTEVNNFKSKFKKIKLLHQKIALERDKIVDEN